MKPHSVKFLIQEKGATYYAWWTICRDFTTSKMLKKYLGKPYQDQLIIFENNESLWGTDYNAWTDFGKTLLSRLKSDPAYVKELYKDHKKIGGRTVETCKKLEHADLGSLSNRDILNLFKRMIAGYLALNEVGFVLVVSDLEHMLLSNTLRSILEKRGIPAEKIQNYLNALMTDDSKNQFWQELQDLYKLMIKYPQTDRLKTSPEFTEHVKKYQWINFGYTGPAWNKQDFIKRIRKLRLENLNIKKAFEKEQRYLKDIRKQRLSIEKELKLTSAEKHLFAVARLFSYLKTYRVEVRYYFCHISYQLFKELSRRFSLPVHWFEWASQQEIQNLLTGKKFNKNKPLTRRMFLAELWEYGKMREFKKPQLRKFVKKILIKEEITHTDCLQGQAAFLGRVQGAAKIILSPKDIGKVKKGDVLIAIYTDPNLLPAMERATAFVTDQGGITSHAAITAREMKKPCIIGTKYATKIFKDGDLVEVDANKGIVKKIS